MKRQVLFAAAAVTLGFALQAPTASASCLPMTPAQQRAQATVIFEGVALEGPTASGIQRFRVTRYLKSSGPSIVRVDTGYKKGPNGSTITSVSIVVHRGEKWRIYAHGAARTVMTTNACLGSRKL